MGEILMPTEARDGEARYCGRCGAYALDTHFVDGECLGEWAKNGSSLADVVRTLEEMRAALLAAAKALEEAKRNLSAARELDALRVAACEEASSLLHAAESRAARLLAAMREIEGKTGHFGEAPPPPEWMPMLSLIAWVGRTARAAIAAEEGK